MWDLLHAWREWLAGHDTSQLRVFGIAVLWWGRLGKTLEFLGGLTVVIDLLGRARMETFHANLRTRRARLSSLMRGWGGPRRKSPPRPRPVRPPGLVAFHRVAAVALAVFLMFRYFEGGGGSIAVTVIVLLSLAFSAFLGGIALGEVCYLISLELLKGLVGATLRLPGAHPGLARTQAALRNSRARLRARWHGARTPGEEPPPPRPKGDPPGLRAFIIAGTVLMGLFLFVTAHYEYARPDNDPMPLPILLAMIVILSPAIGGFVLGGGGYLLGLLLLEGFVVTTLGQLKTRAGLESRLKWIGLIIFAAGFSLDLLSS